MQDLLVCIYMCRKEGMYQAFMTHDPGVDLSILREAGYPGCLDILTPFLPIGIINFVLKNVFSAEEIEGCPLRDVYLDQKLFSMRKGKSYDDLLKLKFAKVIKILGQMQKGYAGKALVPDQTGFPVRATEQDFPRPERDCTSLQKDSWEVYKALAGRILFLEELESSLLEQGFKTPGNLMDIIQRLALGGKVQILPALGFSAPGEITCYRCGNKIEGISLLKSRQIPAQLFRADCPICKFPSLYCEQCNNLGESRLCRGLLTAELDNKVILSEPIKCISVEINNLTPAQSKASATLVNFVEDYSKSEILLWAVTGAGKTEVIVGAAASVIRKGGRVLYATPRRDVVQEIAPRLAAIFKDCKILANYGGSLEKFQSAPLTIATTHQVLRYYRHFDLVILDEYDAYPYQGNKMLHMAVQRATRPGGKTVYLTATPDREILSRVKFGSTQLITIPARYHGHPVPEPQIIKAPAFNKSKKGKPTVDFFVPQLLCRWLNGGAQIFVFLPTVHMVMEYGPVLIDGVISLTDDSIKTKISLSYAKDPGRDRNRESFKSGATRILITTTIMERGITVKNANVLVLEADYERIFDDGTLIQMAGRAGRSKEFPHGEVVFIGKRCSDSMKSARGKIVFLNSIARKDGYLKP